MEDLVKLAAALRFKDPMEALKRHRLHAVDRPYFYDAAVGDHVGLDMKRGNGKQGVIRCVKQRA